MRAEPVLEPGHRRGILRIADYVLYDQLHVDDVLIPGEHEGFSGYRPGAAAVGPKPISALRTWDTSTVIASMIGLGSR